MILRVLDGIAFAVVVGCVIMVSLGVRQSLGSGGIEPAIENRIDAIDGVTSVEAPPAGGSSGSGDSRPEDRLEERLQRIEERAARLR